MGKFRVRADVLKQRNGLGFVNVPVEHRHVHVDEREVAFHSELS